MFIWKKIGRMSCALLILSTCLFLGLTRPKDAPLTYSFLAPRTLSSAELKLIKEIGPYPELLSLVFDNQAVLEALVSDPVLRPVFLACPPDEALGEIHLNGNHKSLLDRYGGEKLLAQYSGFLAGTTETAQKMLAQGYRIVVGVTDRYSDPMVRQKGGKYSGGTMNFPVANGRQCYFPLPDRTWLGIKGTGQFTYTNKKPFFFDEVFTQWSGLARESETVNLFQSAKEVTEQASFIRTFGYRQINKLCDGEGGFTDVSSLDLKDKYNNPLQPVLIFNHTITPHRLCKLPQLLQTDPTLKQLIERVSAGLLRENKITKAFTTPEAYFAFVIEEMAVSEAAKINNLKIKKTIHSQDFTVAGEESDLEELMSFKTYLAVQLMPSARKMFTMGSSSQTPYHQALDRMVMRSDELAKKDFESLDDFDDDELLVFLRDSGFSTKFNFLSEILAYGKSEGIDFLKDPVLMKKYFRIYMTTFFKEIKSDRVRDICSTFDKKSLAIMMLKKFARLLAPEKTTDRQSQIDKIVEELKIEIRAIAFPNGKQPSLDSYSSSLADLIISSV